MMKTIHLSDDHNRYSLVAMLVKYELFELQMKGMFNCSLQFMCYRIILIQLYKSLRPPQQTVESKNFKINYSSIINFKINY